MTTRTLNDTKDIRCQDKSFYESNILPPSVEQRLHVRV